MAGESKATTATRAKPPAAAAPAAGQDALSVKDLASGILSKEIRPRAADIRRLAEAVLDGSGKPKKAKDKADGGKKDKSKKNKKKLAKIPGQSKN